MNRRFGAQNANDSFLNPHDASFLSSRTVASSSASMISSPSNNIRKYQQQAHDNGKKGDRLRQSQASGIGKTRTQNPKPKKSSTVSLVKNKLLNLQKSAKIYTKKVGTNDESTNGMAHKSFVVRKPINMNSYDFSVFAKYSSEMESDQLPPAIRESQIKAWEAAEKIANNLIFDNDSDFSDDEIIEGETHEEIVAEAVDVSEQIIRSIPGFTKGELEIVTARFAQQQQLTQDDERDPKTAEEEERQMLWKYRQTHQQDQEKVFGQYAALTGKRKVQVTQKKDLLHKIFGYNNTLNQEYITNNTSYSALDNIMNTQKAFHEDKEEINLILNEDKEYHVALEETRLMHGGAPFEMVTDSVKKKYYKANDMESWDHQKFQSLVSWKLGQIYERKQADNAADGELSRDAYEELQSFTMAYLRKCIKHETANSYDNE